MEESGIRDIEEPQKKISGGMPILEVPDESTSEGPILKNTDGFKGNPYLDSPVKKLNKAISPFKSSTKIPKITDRCPLLYWAFDYNDHWYVIVKEDKVCTFTFL